MKTLLFAGLLAAAIASPAVACRGTAEYPEVQAKLAQSDLPVAEKRAYKKRLEQGEALHRRAHREGNPDLGKDSLKILDEIKAKLTQ